MPDQAAAVDELLLDEQGRRTYDLPVARDSDEDKVDWVALHRLEESAGLRRSEAAGIAEVREGVDQPLSDVPISQLPHLVFLSPSTRRAVLLHRAQRGGGG